MSMIAKEVKDFFDVGMRDNFSPIVIVDKDYRIERVNAAGQALLQKISQSGEEKFEGRCIAEMLPSIKDNSRITDSVFEVKIDGSIYYMVPFRTLRDQDDGTIAILFIDIYANREIESAIAYRREITSDFEEILEGSFDGILVTDAEGKVLFVNSSYERVAEIKRADIEGKYMRDLLNPVWMPESVAHIVAREKTVVSKRQVVKSGRHIMVTGRPVFDEHKNIKKIVINARDITEIYNLTYDLIKALEHYPWPGNVRQLKNIMENMVVVSNNEYLQPEDLPWNESGKKGMTAQLIDSLAENEEIGLNEAIDALELQILTNAKETCGTTRKIAEKLKVNQSTIVRKLQKYGLE